MALRRVKLLVLLRVPLESNFNSCLMNVRILFASRRRPGIKLSQMYGDWWTRSGDGGPLDSRGGSGHSLRSQAVSERKCGENWRCGVKGGEQ
jgi:hypothetical protein